MTEALFLNCTILYWRRIFLVIFCSAFKICTPYYLHQSFKKRGLSFRGTKAGFGVGNNKFKIEDHKPAKLALLNREAIISFIKRNNLIKQLFVYQRK
jgi:hypothetical protein